MTAAQLMSVAASNRTNNYISGYTAPLELAVFATGDV